VSTSTSSRTRKPAGVPVGGQFASEQRPRAAVALAEPPPDPEALLDQARTSSSFWAARYGAGSDVAEEATGRAALATLEAFTRAQQEQLGDDGQPLTDASDRSEGIGNLRAYVHRSAMTHVLLELAARTATPRQSNDSRARRLFDLRCNELAVEMGRSLTPREQENLAAEIRQGFPDNARPHKDFFRDNRSQVMAFGTDATDVDAFRADRHYSVGFSSHATAPQDEEPPPGSARARAEAILAEGGRAAQLSAKTFAWSLVAERTGAPHPSPASLSEYAAARTRKSVREAGGAVAVARSIRTGEKPPPEVHEALFKPFGPLDAQQRTAVVDLILAHPGYGDDLWDASVTASTNLLTRKK
jgi:hypothetical protein